MAEETALSRLWGACDRSLAMRDEDDGLRPRVPPHLAPRECGCGPEVLRCAHISEPCGCAKREREGSMWVKLIAIEEHYEILIDCMDGARGTGANRQDTLAAAYEVFEAHEVAMRQTLEAIVDV